VLLLLGTIGWTLLCIVRHGLARHRAGRPAALRALLAAAALFLIALAVTLNLSQHYLLFGYKSVDNQLNPTLIDGDHYLADKLFYKWQGVHKGDVLVIRTNQRRVHAARLIALPGDSFETHRLTANEYAVAVADAPQQPQIIHKEQILARPLIIYGTYDQVSGQIVRERLGRLVR
jgi:hypothetical protein